ncbi:MAG: rhamnulokinase [Ruminiclostridium sp.]|nr:rhamnulokinase [Ruminiclostridium sp.]
MSKVLVFDFGASSARAIMVETDGKNLKTEEIHRFPNNPITVNDTLYWDIDTLLSEVKTAVIKADSYGFEAVSVDTWGVDFAIMDDEGNFVEKPVHYRDKRTANVIDEVNALFGGADKLYMKTGIQSAWFNTIYQLYALKKTRPESLSGKVHFLMMPDLIAHYLTGSFRNEYAEATTSSLLNPETKDWDKEILEKLGISPEIFCPMINSGEIYGFLKPEFTRRRMNIPVVAVPSHDTAAAVAAVPSEEKEFLFISTGTWALFGTELSAPVISEEAYKAGLTNEGGHSGTVTFLKNIMGMWLFQEIRRDFTEKGVPLSFAEMETLARNAKPSVSFINPNDESFSQPGDMPEKVKKYVEKTGQKPLSSISEILRCVYDSLAREFSSTLADIEKITGKSYNKIYMFGGGTKDSLLCQLTADASGRTVVAGPTEATSIGNALCAFVGSGAIPSVAEARKIVISAGLTKTYKPCNDALI